MGSVRHKVVFVCMLLCLLLQTGIAFAVTRFVTNTNDSGAGSLRAALSVASNGDAINFASGLSGNIVLSSPIISPTVEFVPTIYFYQTGTLGLITVSASPSYTGGLWQTQNTEKTSVGGQLLVFNFADANYGMTAAGGVLGLTTTGSTKGSVFGAGVAVFGNTGEFSSLVEGNVATVNSVGGDATARGGGAYFANDLTSISGVVSKNSVVATSLTGTSFAYGGGFYVEQSTTDMSGSITGNIAQANNTDGWSFALGGGGYANYGLTNLSGVVADNKAISISANGFSIAMGGGLYTGSMASLSGYVIDNTAVATNTDGTSITRGGGVYVSSSLTDLSGVVSGNTAESNSVNDDTYAFGGGIYSASVSGNISGDLVGNSATANSANSDAYAYGGGIYSISVLGNMSGNLSDNTVMAISPNGSALALGGGAYIDQTAMVITGGYYKDNRAIATGAVARAEGGALFLNTESPTGANLTMDSTLADIVFQGNSVSDNGVTSSNDIHFGRGNASSLSGANASMLLTGNSNSVSVLGGITVDMKDASFHLEKNGSNLFNWGGENVFLTENGIARVDLNAGQTILQQNFSLAGTQIDFNLGNGSGLYTAVGAVPAEINVDRADMGTATLGARGFAYGSVLVPGERLEVLRVTAATSLDGNNILLDNNSFFSRGAYDYSYTSLEWVVDSTTGVLSLVVAGSSYVPERGGSYGTGAPMAVSLSNPSNASIWEQQADLFACLREHNKKLIPRYLTEPLAAENACQSGEEKRRFWATPLYNFTRTDEVSGMAGSKIKTPGLILGYDVKTSDKSFLGGAVSVVWPDYRAGGDNTDGTDVRLLVYGGQLLGKDWELGYFASYGWGSWQQKRHVVDERYFSRYNNNTYNLGLSVGKSIDLKERRVIRPYLSYEYIGVRTDGYSEEPGLYSLSFAGHGERIGRLRLGGDYTKYFKNGGFLRSSLFYMRQHGDRAAKTTAFFNADPLDPFTSMASATDEHNFGSSIAASFPLGVNADVIFTYTSILGSDGSSRNFDLSYIYRF